VGTHPSKVQGKREHKWTQTKEKKTINPKKKRKKKEIKILSKEDNNNKEDLR
jgi:hypothetical protein